MGNNDYKKNFVKGFAALFMSQEARDNHESHGITGMDFDPDKEIVTVHFGEDCTRTVNVYGDSLSAITYDILKQALDY